MAVMLSPVKILCVLVFAIVTVLTDAIDCPFNETEVDRTGRRCNRDAASCSGVSDKSECKGKRRCRCDDICSFICIRVFKDYYCDVEQLGPLTVGLSVSYTREPVRFGTNATFSCDPGYMLSDDSLSIRKCRGDERWSGETPTCVTDVSCGPPPSVYRARHNGTDVRGDDRLIYGIGERLKFTCWSGYYRRQGSPYITCKRDEFNSSLANWTAVDPYLECYPVSCGSPGSVSNGHRNGNVFSFGSQVTFECDSGYQLSGRSYRTCQADGEWDGYVPSCNPIRCPSISTPGNGDLFGSSYTYRSKITIDCDEGFVVAGTDLQSLTVVCQASKTWSHSPQTCQAVNCGNPGTPLNGTRNGDNFGYNGYILFSCDDNFRLEGSKSIFCKGNNKWSEPTPICIGQCELPELPDNLKQISGYYSGDVVDEGTSYLILCNKGYTLNSLTSWRCLATGKMSFVPVCIEDPCLELQEIENGWTEYNSLADEEASYLPGTIATYYCDEGYAVNKEYQQRTCRQGIFTGENPTCTLTTCHVPIIPNAELISNAGTVYHGMLVNYTCDVGYETEDELTITCWNETLTPPVPKCSENPCLELQEIENGWTEYNSLADEEGSYLPGTIATYYCDEGYAVNKEYQQRICRRGIFTGENPTCTLTTCDVPAILNGNLVGLPRIVNHGVSVIYNKGCNKGYHMEGSSTVLCWNETITPTPPLCHEDPCSKVSDIRNGMVEYDTMEDDNGMLPPGTNVTYQCREGYKFSDGSVQIRNCRKGSFSRSSPVCLLSTCHVPVISNAELSNAGTVYHGMLVNYTCDVGYQTEGELTITCWNETLTPPVPKCSEITTLQQSDVLVELTIGCVGFLIGCLLLLCIFFSVKKSCHAVNKNQTDPQCQSKQSVYQSFIKDDGKQKVKEVGGVRKTQVMEEDLELITPLHNSLSDNRDLELNVIEETVA